MKRLATPSCIAAAALLAGCGFHERPTFDLAEVYALPAEQPAEADVLVFVVEGRNDNPEPLPLRDVRYALTLNGGPPLSVHRSAEATLPGRGVQRFELPVAVPRGRTAPGADDYRLAGAVEYQVPGALADLLFDNRVRVPTASFSFSGDLMDEPAAAPDAQAPPPPPPPPAEG